MCISIPAKVIELNDKEITVDILGRIKTVYPAIEVKKGDWVLLYGNLAIKSIDEESALEALQFLKPTKLVMT